MATTGKLIRTTLEEARARVASGESKSNWAYVNSLTEEQLEALIDHEEEGEFDWDSVVVGPSSAKQQLTLRIDQDVIEWFRAQGAGYQTRMNQVLRSYVDAQRRKSGQ